MAIESDDPATGELPRVSSDDTGGPPRPRRFRPFRFTLKLLAFVAIIYFAMLTIIPGVREATGKLRTVNPALLGLGLVLEIAALFAYTLLTTGGPRDEESKKISRMRLFRIQMSTKALSSIVPGGSAAGSAIGVPADDPVGCPRARRRVCAGDRRPRVPPSCSTSSSGSR